jgi:hypothetical protein
MAPAQPRQREGLRISTLVIAAIASGAAAVIVSHFWAKGTIFASAMTPVIVALVSEALRKPVESEIVRRPLRVARSAVTSNVPVTFDRQADEGAAAQDVRIYSSGSQKVRTGGGGGARRKLHLKVALVTGLIAFLIGAAFLTLPEIIFGGSVTGQHSTTYFGGSTKSSNSSSTTRDKSSSDSKDSTDSKSDSSKDTTTDESTDSTDQSTTTAPDNTTTDPATTPQQTTTQQTAPPPTTPTVPATPPPAAPTP